MNGPSFHGITVTTRAGIYELSIPELLLRVRGRQLESTYARLLEMKRQVLALVREIDDQSPGLPSLLQIDR